MTNPTTAQSQAVKLSASSLCKRYYFPILLLIGLLFHRAALAQPSANDAAIVISGPYHAAPGATISYQLMITYTGPNTLTNALLTMPAVPNFTAQSITCESGTSSNGNSVCPDPADLTIANLEGSGIVLPSIPYQGALIITVTGQVANVANYSEINLAASLANTGDANTTNNTSNFTTTIHSLTGGMVSTYVLNYSDLSTAANPAGGTIQMNFVLDEGPPVPGLGTQFTVPLTYGPMENFIGNGVTYEWDRYGQYTDGGGSYDDLLSFVPRQAPLFTNLPASNTASYPYGLPLTGDAQVREWLNDGSGLRPLGMFNITLGDPPSFAPGTSFVCDDPGMFIWGAYILQPSANELLWATALGPMAQLETTTAFPNSPILSVPLGNNYPIRYTAALRTGIPEPADMILGDQYWFNIGGEVKIFTPSALLPVALTNFTARLQDRAARLQWNTQTESNNKGFDVLRSTDGNNWSSIGFVASQAKDGNSQQQLNYQFTDRYPAKGINYYRLKQVDLNGKTTFSEIRSVQTGDEQQTPAILLNPVKSFVRLGALPVGGTVAIFTQAGQQALPVRRITSTLQEFNVALLKNGIYYVRVTDTQGRVTSLKMLKE